MRIPYSAASLLLLLACTGTSAPPKAPEAAPSSMPVMEPPATPAPVEDPVLPALGEQSPGAVLTPAELYAECEGRLEQPEAEGECSADADCAPAGCSSERCITKASAQDLMGTCEMLPCFEVVDTCSCQQGRCRWSLK